MAADKAAPAEIVAEFVGTFLLVFTIGCNVLSGGSWAGVSIACVLMVVIFAFGGISGANFNPAVSFALSFLDAENVQGWGKTAIYSVVQIAAGIIAGFCYRGVFGKSFALPTHDPAGANLCETLYTFMLCFVVLNVAAVKKGCQPWFGLAIGFVIIAGAYGAGAVSGGCFNPAVALGIDVSHNIKPWTSLGYIVSEIVGALIAVFLFRTVRPERGTKEESEKGPANQSDTVVLASEFLGTFILVLTVGLNVLAGSAAAAYSIAASLMCMIYALGDVSGGVFNPAVALAVHIHNPEALGGGARVGKYMLIQIVGGCVAAGCYIAVHDKAFELGPGAGYTSVQALVAEFVFTFVLCLVVLCAAVNGKTKSPQFFALAIGSCVTVGGFAIGAVSGGSLNPAVSFGIGFGAVFYHGSRSLVNAALYSLAEFAGAGAAAGIVMVTHAEEKLPEK